MLESAFLISTGGLVLWSNAPIPAHTDLLNRFLISTFLQSSRRLQDLGREEVDGHTFEWLQIADTPFVATASYQGILEVGNVGHFLQGMSSAVRAANIAPSSCRIPDKLAHRLDEWMAKSQMDNITHNEGGGGLIYGDGGQSEVERSAAVNDTNALPITRSTGFPQSKRQTSKNPSKKKRNWDGGMPEGDSAAQLDFSEAKSGSSDSEFANDVSTGLSATDFKGNELPLPPQPQGTTAQRDGFLTRLFSSALGMRKFSNSDIVETSESVKSELLNKNVSETVAARICQTLQHKLLGVKGERNMKSVVRTTIRTILQSILTPDSSFDLISDIRSRSGTSRPYVISIFGVNGVGKSTSLAKLSFYILQHNLKVLVVAGDTFRSGAVEQLKAHVKNLKAIHMGNNSMIELYEGGYGKDASMIARKAVELAAQNGFDVVIVDTAGRRHNDARLMSGLERFMEVVKPDRSLLVAEALAGSDSIQQAINFNASLGKNRKLDGFIVTKCDSVGNMVGTLVNMAHTTSLPVLFLGTGQSYGDLRTMNVDWVCDLLLL